MRFHILILTICVMVAGCSDQQANFSPPTNQISTGLLPSDAELDPEKQQAIWDAEHVTFCLEQRFGKMFTAALKSHDTDALQNFFMPAASGEWVEFANDIFAQGGFEEQACSTNRTPLTFDALLTAIADLSAEYETISKVGFRVLSIQMTNETNAIWQSDVQVTVSGKLDGRTSYRKTIATITYQAETPLELGTKPFIHSWVTTDQITRSSEAALFSEVTARFTLDRLPLIDNWKIPAEQSAQYRSQLAVADFDQDGFNDIAIGTFTGEPILLKNIGGRSFNRIDQQVGLRRWAPNEETSLVAWIDVDNDGYQDLIMGNRIYKNVEGRRFSDITSSSGLSVNRQPMGAAIADYDADGDLDIYICYQYPAEDEPQKEGPSPWVGDDSSGGANHLWQNQGNGSFREVGQASGVSAGTRKSFAANWLFYNDDHFPDLYIANDFGTNNLLLNQGDGTFEDISFTSNTADFATSMGVATGHLDSDGRPEIYVANMYSKMGRRIIGQVSAADYPDGIYQQIKGSCAGNRLYSPSVDDPQRCEENSIALGINDIGWAYAPAFADFDGNGWADIYATTGFMSRDRSKPDG